MKYIKIYEDYLDDKPQINSNNIGKSSIKTKIDTLKGNLSYKEYIDEILTKLGYEAEHLISYGSYGSAIKLKNNLVLKLTTDKAELENAFYIKKYNLKHVVKYKDVYKMAVPNWYDCYIGILVMEYLTPLSDDVARYMDKIYLEYAVKDGSETLNNIIRARNDHETLISQIPNDIYDNIIDIMTELKKNSLTPIDFKSKNMGTDENGVIKIFDIGIYRNSALSTLETIPNIYLNF